MFNAIHHVAIICSDYPRSKRFYTEVLGLKVIAENYREARDSYKLDLALPDGRQVELFSFPGAPERPSFPEAQGLRHLAFLVDDVEQVKAYLESNGVWTNSQAKHLPSSKIQMACHWRFTRNKKSQHVAGSFTIPFFVCY
ncbi:VOC family protein [Vibrio alginolyticus]|nr:VOC family protein [Vibrio alginolyticus]MCG6352519.1 VOC family protein [Vibrio alginolyticus]